MKEKAGPKLEVLAASGNQPSHLYPEGKMNDLFDGDPETEVNRCYISNWYYNGLVVFEINMAYVTHVKLLTIGDAACTYLYHDLNFLQEKKFELFFRSLHFGC